jgi:hypothetical protein
MARIANVCLQPRRSAPPAHRSTSVPRRSTKRTPAAVPAPADADRAETVEEEAAAASRAQAAQLRTALVAAHKTSAVAVAKTRADSETLCAAAVARGRPARHTHARCRHKQARRNHGVCGAPPSSAALPLPVPAARASGQCLGRPALLPGACTSVARRGRPSLARHGPWDGTARHARRPPPSHVTDAVRGGQKSLHVAAAQRHPSVVRVPVCVCVGGFSMQGTRGRGHSHRCLLLSLSLCLSVSVRERGTGSLSVLFPSLHLAPPHCDRVPVRASCLVLCLATLCVCVHVPVYAMCLSSCAAVCGQPLSAACVCLCPCVCVRPRLSSFSWHGRGPLSPSLPHTLIHAACGGAGGGIEGQQGRLKQQRVHCVGEKGPLGAVWMRRLRHAWGGHSERERERRVLQRQGGCRVCLPWRPSSTMRSKSARRGCRTMAHGSSTVEPVRVRPVRLIPC